MMSQPQLLYWLCLLVGLLLIGAEIYVPGGIVGSLGVLALVAAAIIGGVNFAPPYNILSIIVIVVLSGVGLYFWMRFFPQSKMGHKLTLNADGRPFKSAAVEAGVAPQAEGEALSPLRPAGVARVAGQRVDVVAESSWIPSGARIRVIEVAGNRVVVRQMAPVPSHTEPSGS